MNLKVSPLVSIVIPCYNHEAYVQECIQSIIDQDYQNIELIIIDDGSKDRSTDVISKMVPACMDRFVRFEFRSRTNQGLCNTLNEAIDWCHGEFYSPIASDDVMLPQKTSTQVKYFIENSQCVSMYSDVELICSNGKVEKKKKIRKRCNYNFEDIFLRRYYLPAPTKMTKLSIIKEVGGYKSDIIFEDMYMMLAIANKRFNIHFIPEILCKYRKHDSNTSSNDTIMINGHKQIDAIYADNPFKVEADSITLMINAAKTARIDKRASLSLACNAIIKYPKIVLSKRFIWYVRHFILT